MSFLWKTTLNNSSSKHGSMTTLEVKEAGEDQNRNNRSKATMTESNTDFLKVRGFPRIIEARFGESLGNRASILSDLAGAESLGLGPPDLVHLTRYDKFHKEELGEYFYTTGLDLSSPSTPLELLKLLRADQEETQKGSSDNYVATYCSVNIFSKTDVIIRYNSDGSYGVSAVDCLDPTKQRTVLTDEEWEETFLSGCIRSIIMNYDVERKLPGLVEFPLYTNLDWGRLGKKIIGHFCRFVPRCLSSGWATNESINPTITNNHFMKAMLLFLQIAPDLVDYAVAILRGLIVQDKQRELYYKVAIILILEQSNDREFELIKLLNEAIDSSLSLLESLSPKSAEFSQISSILACLLTLQTKFLLNKEDFQLALSTAKFAATFSLDSPNTWYYLAKCYICTEQYSEALLTINSMPELPSVDQSKRALFALPGLYDYYMRPLNSSRNHMLLDSKEYNTLSNTLRNYKDSKLKQLIFGRIVMPDEPKNGYIKRIWDGVAGDIGPVYGPQSCNLVNFVSPMEVKAISDVELLARNTIAKQYSWFEKRACQLLMELVLQIGWNKLLEYRSEVFVMEREYSSSDSSVNKLNKDIPINLRKKRICERWLDQLFLDVYGDLLVSGKGIAAEDAKYTGLEWELLGLTQLRVWNWQEAVTCLRTSIAARFDVVSSRNLLQLYLREGCGEPFTGLLDLDMVIELVTQQISYDMRFYDMFQIMNLRVLFKLCEQLGMDGLRSRIAVLPFVEPPFLNMLDKMLGWITEMTSD